MRTFVEDSVFFGVTVTLLAYWVGLRIKEKWKWSILNPLLLAIVFTIVLLAVTGVPYETYAQGARYVSYLLTPATVCLAIPLYEQLSLLRKHWKAVLAGIFSGVLTSLCCVLVMAVLFGLSHADYVTLLPKSITTAIGIGISEELGGYVSLTVAVIIITGVLGNLMGRTVCRLFRIEEPIAQGVAIGTSSHAIGTSMAMELGETQGAMSSLSIAVSGLLTVVGASVFAAFW